MIQTQQAKLLAAICAHPGRTPAELARITRMKPNSVGPYLAMLFDNGKVDRIETRRPFIYYEKGRLPANPRSLTPPTKEEALAAFEAATAGVEHDPGAMEAARASFLALSESNREEFRRAVDCYMAVARTNPPKPVRPRAVPALPGAATPYKAAVATVKTARAALEDRAEERRLAKLDEFPLVAARRRLARGERPGRH